MKDGGEVADAEGRDGLPDGVTCFGTAEDVPYCNGAECPEWEECHGDRLRGYSARASEWREAFGL